MNQIFPPPPAPFFACVDCHATLGRLIGNLSGFLYRRRHDPHWTMEFISAGCRDVTGYDAHRFLANASLAFGDLIARSDRKRVNEQVRLAVQARRRSTLEYSVRTAHGALVRVEDRFTPVVSAAGKVLAIEGIIDRARWTQGPSTRLSTPDESRLAALCHSPSSN